MSSCSTLSRENHRVFPIDPTDLSAESECFQEMRQLLERERVRSEATGGQLSLVVFMLKPLKGEFTFAAHVMWTILTVAGNRGEVGWFDECHIGLVMPGYSGERVAALAGEIRRAVPPEISLAWTVFEYRRFWLEDIGEYSRATGMYSGPVTPGTMPEMIHRRRVIPLDLRGRERVGSVGEYRRSLRTEQ